MTTMKRMKQNKNFWTLFLICICLALILVGGNYYVRSLHQDLSEQTISNVLTVTQRQQQAFDTFISGDRERLHSFATYFSHAKSTDIDQIQEKLNVFAEVDAFYSVINLETGVSCNNKTDEVYQISSQELEIFRSFSGSGARNPYKSLFSADIMFGYYECFTFADGVSGVFQKSYDCSKVSEEFSLSFCNDQGLGFIVTRQGDILLRSVDKAGRYSFDNIFEMVAEPAGNQSNIAALTQALNHQETGTAVFTSDTGDYAYAYVPVQNVDNWYLISIVPIDAVAQETDEIIMNSQSVLLVFLVVVIVFLAFVLIIWRNHKNLEEKDIEIEYRERRFDIFSTHLANNTDDIYMMLTSNGEQAEYISPNVERVLGISERPF